MTEQLDIRPYKRSEKLMYWAYWGRSKSLTVCFSGIGSGQPVQPFEFVDTASNGGEDSVLFVADTTRSWLNAPGMIEEVVAEIEGFRDAIGAQVVNTLGHSMGGYMALLIPGFTRVAAAVGFSPQVSVHPQVAGDDPRWMEHRDQIDSFRIRSVMDHLDPATRYYVMHGLSSRERFQRNRFDLRDNLTHYLFRKVTHEVPQKLRRAGIMRDVVWSCFHDRNHRLRLAMRQVDAYLRRPGELELLPPSGSLSLDEGREVG